MYYARCVYNELMNNYMVYVCTERRWQKTKCYIRETDNGREYVNNSYLVAVGLLAAAF